MGPETCGCRIVGAVKRVSGGTACVTVSGVLLSLKGDSRTLLVNPVVQGREPWMSRRSRGGARSAGSDRSWLDAGGTDRSWLRSCVGGSGKGDMFANREPLPAGLAWVAGAGVLQG